MFKNILIGSLLIYGLVMSYFAYPVIDQIVKDYNLAPTVESSRLHKDQAKFFKDLGFLIAYINEQGYDATGGELYRSMYQQRYNVAKGYSKTFNSKHLKRLAIDIHIFDSNGNFCETKLTDECKAIYKDLGNFWESLDYQNKYGGFWHSFKDYPHFQRNPSLL